ncbi:hypothetical protein B0H21DRAFT_689040 [Amylocystis lapponica]|nr:hypothetical protein B0H21DRAFT_689040 [Amylocystis lapponica]
MEGKSQTEQEKEVRELLRRAERTPSRTSSQRKDALRKLIELAHSPYPNLKVIAATNVRFFIKDFPDLEDDAINAVYDLCEDPVTQVRIKGYAAIVDVSKEQKKWVKRNADVLVQLLQSDEPDEVIFVKRALTQHLDMDPAVTLGVLCDQIVPSDELMDEEERAIRDRLRSLVLAFITDDAKRAIVERHTKSAGSPAEEVLTSGLFKAVAQLPPDDIDVIVKDILLSMASFKPLCSRGKQLLDIVLDRARATLKTDLQPGSENSSLGHARYYLQLASFIAVDRRVGHPLHLLRFYVSSLMSKMTLLRLTEDARYFVISHIANILTACEEAEQAAESADSTESGQLRRQVIDTLAVLFQIFTEAKSGDQRPWKACLLLLRACVRVSLGF